MASVNSRVARALAPLETGSALATNCVDFVYEHDARRMLFGLIEKISHT